MSKRGWKQIVYTCILVILVIGLTGCGNNNDKTTNGNNTGNNAGNTAGNAGGNNAGNGTTTAAGDPINGEVVYTNNCLPCHGKGGENGHNGPNLVKSELVKDTNQAYDRVMNGKGGMPSFKGTLSEVEIQDVVAYVHQLATGK
jgi:mono/diheme cytochrome c family protein